MSEDGNQPAFGRLAWDNNRSARPPLEQARPVIERQPPFGLADRVVAMLALLDQNGPNLLFEEFAVGRGESLFGPQGIPPHPSQKSRE
jgi:hypothetical protein